MEILRGKRRGSVTDGVFRFKEIELKYFLPFAQGQHSRSDQIRGIVGSDMLIHGLRLG